MPSGCHCSWWKSAFDYIVPPYTTVTVPLLLSRWLVSLTSSSLIMIYWGMALFVFIILWLIELLGFGRLMLNIRPGKLLAMISFSVLFFHTSHSGIPIMYMFVHFILYFMFLKCCSFFFSHFFSSVLQVGQLLCWSIFKLTDSIWHLQAAIDLSFQLLYFSNPEFLSLSLSLPLVTLIFVEVVCLFSPWFVHSVALASLCMAGKGSCLVL